jgi:hypothetical protein
MAKKHKEKEAKPMPGGTHGAHEETKSQVKPGPINDPSMHPVNNVPQATDSRWAEQLDPNQVPGAF